MNLKRFALCTILLATSYGIAQDYPKLELAAGYSYGSVDTQGYGTQRDAQGWSGSFVANMRRWVGLEAEVSDRRQNLNFGFNGTPLTVNANYYSFVGGPRFAHRFGKVTPFVHGLFGLDRSPGYAYTVYDASTGTSQTPYVSGFASVAGGGMDFVVNRHVSFRTQSDYFFTHHLITLSSTPNNFRVQAGIVFTFGGSESAYARRHTTEPTVARLPLPSPIHPEVVAVAVEPTPVMPAGSQLASVLPPADPIKPALMIAGVTRSGDIPVVTKSADVATKLAEESAKPAAHPTLQATVPSSAPAVTVATAVSTAHTEVAKPIAAVIVLPKPQAVVALTEPRSPRQDNPSATLQTTAPTAVASKSILADSHTVIISQASTSEQAGTNEEEPLGDIARRYRERKAAESKSGF